MPHEGDHVSVAPTGERAKSFGAFYTDRAVADFLVGWAVQSRDDPVLDPSFGGGVFLEAALRRLDDAHTHKLYGVELDSEVHARVSGDFLRLEAYPPKTSSVRRLSLT